MSEVNYTAIVTENLNREINSAEAAIAKFNERMQTNPMYALEWANEVYTAVAAKGQLEYIQKAVVNAQEDGLTKEEYAEFLKSLDRFFAGELRHTGVSDSTSGSARLLNTARAETAAKWFDPSGWNLGVSRPMVEKALREHVGMKYDINDFSEEAMTAIYGNFYTLVGFEVNTPAGQVKVDLMSEEKAAFANWDGEESDEINAILRAVKVRAIES